MASLEQLLARLSLEQKVSLVTGQDFWSTMHIDTIGLRSIVFSDGPTGVRGPIWDERLPSTNMPSATALAASWDPRLAWRYGALAAAEARAKGVDVVLGPTLNLHRSPLGGRTFEALSEDPELTAVLGTAFVRGLQDHGVAASPKHYVANDSETERFTVDVRMSERTLRELYLAPFERAIVDGGAWAVMSSYNSVDGVTMTESALLDRPLKDEWGFDGVVVSDWTAVRSLSAAAASQDLAMPGPAGPWGAALVEAVLAGRISEQAIDRKTLRLLQLAQRVGALGSDRRPTLLPIDGPRLARTAAVDGMVMVRNDGLLPLARSAVPSIAVIGDNALRVRTQGGGSATVIPKAIISPLDGIRATVPNARVTYSLGAVVHEGLMEIPVAALRHPSGAPGLVAKFMDSSGNVLLEEHRLSTSLVWFAREAPTETASHLELTTTYYPEETGSIELGFASVLPGELWVDGKQFLSASLHVDGADPGAALLTPPSESRTIEMTQGTPVEILATFNLDGIPPHLRAAISVTLGIGPSPSDPQRLIDEAVEAARTSTVAVVVVGANSTSESEGYDRRDLLLPGHQDELVRAVAAVNPSTIVVVNAAAPVLLPWRNEVAAVLLGHFGGQEFGATLSDVLFGDVEPGGRLATTWPAAIEDVPVLDVVPTNGVLEYAEGIHVGYRAWLRAQATPAYAFGEGRGYSRWSFDRLELLGSLTPETAPIARVTISNVGDRAGKEVVQVYASRRHSTVDRPVRWLIGFAPVLASRGESIRVDIPLRSRSFAHWDEGWRFEAGDFHLHVGPSSVDLPLEVDIAMTATGETNTPGQPIRGG